MTVTQISATGTFKADFTQVKFIMLTPAAATATLVVRDGGAGGTTRVSMQALTSGGSVSIGPFPDPITFATDVHCTIGGAGALVDIGY
jgi:hypothetical protein